ncbi:hypothetical protein FHS15_004706 [Paenibacillus castaneae]|uniref:hypothetical protein n=1 Tax=Paenibacillus castaneae TaxID=474957 RepID=UPI000C9B3616|nr:hypothetical protein [Paenibacillus castaneae]NIK79545.1 hypothetical protein [Paenibacillus castaneae]
MTMTSHEQKQVELKKFLNILSEDLSLNSGAELEKPRAISDLLLFTGYIPRNEPIDMSKLLSLLLRKLGFDFGSETMVDHMINGGTIDGLMNAGKRT